MYAFARARACAIGLSSLLVVSGWGEVARASEDAATDSTERGRQIFLHQWQVNDPLGEGDGLGPVFNEKSCVACHFLGGVGGAGSNDRNVDVLTAVVPSDKKKLRSFQGFARRVHPAFAGGTTVVLHHSGTDPLYALFRLNFVEEQAAAPELPLQAIFSRSFAKQHQPPPTGRIRSQYGVELMLTHRSATPLFGAGLIDSIPDDALRALANEEAKDDWPVTGRVVGRFGWRGQIADLREFVLGACAIEVGLQTPGHAQGFDPQMPKGRSAKVDLSEQQCTDLIVFIASLPRPRQILPSDPDLAERVERGQNAFDSVGCAVCHRPNVGNVAGIYSDLLVHDMGQWLSDAAGAPDSPTTSSRPVTLCHSSSSSAPSMGGYFGGSSEPRVRAPVPILAERRSEWRTPPLWGVRDSAPYLHDGRAPTIHDAVRWHGGEASETVDRYLALDLAERQDLAYFLSTLAAPEQPAERLAHK